MKNRVSVAVAEEIIMSKVKNYGDELIPFESAIGRVLAEDIKTDRDLPPCDKATMDGIAISYAAYENGTRSFHIKATVAAGDVPVNITAADECIEIMTGAALPETTDTVVPYEDVDIKNDIATLVTASIKKAQNIHRKGKDKKQGEVVATANRFVDAALISMAASIGKSALPVKKLPKVVIISTGDELVPVSAQPSPYQVRSSNIYAIKAVLQQYSLHADMLHLPDEPTITKEKIRDCLAQYDVIILSGGVSMGKFDYVPRVLEELSVAKFFYKVQQRPGKPFWFGAHSNGTLVFAFPGNPVSTFMCLHRYFLPWLEASLMQIPNPSRLSRDQIPNSKFQIPIPIAIGTKYAILNGNVTFSAPLQYFVQVKLGINEHGHILATPMEGNGSGDFANLIDTDAFMELPLEKSNFNVGEVYRVWPFKQLL